MSGAEERPEVTPEEVERLYKRLDKEAESAGYHLNPNKDFTRGLIEGLLVNERRHGYWACPCRLPTGNKAEDLDIICPCDYRDPDLTEHGACFCTLYVSQAAAKGEREISCVPERRPRPEERERLRNQPSKADKTLSYPVWRCRVCGYLCAREEPPEICPICKVKKDRFERFM